MGKKKQMKEYEMDFVVHKLKTYPIYFQHSWDGLKPFEIRRNDREFQKGDTVILREYNKDMLHVSTDYERYTGREVSGKISFVTDFMQKPGYVVLGLIDLARKSES